MLRLFILAAGVALSATAAMGNPIERACLVSGRASSPSLCACIGLAAELTLAPADQRIAARFFEDPQRAQDIRMSDNPRHDQFWERYTRFGQVAEDMCG